MPIGWRRFWRSELEKIPQVKLTQAVESNGVFATIPTEIHSGTSEEVLLLCLE